MCISVRKNHSGTQRGTQSDTQFLPKVRMKIHPFIPIGGFEPLPKLGRYIEFS